MSELTGPGVSTCERHKSRASRQKSGRRRPMRRQSGFLAGNGERGPNLTAIFHPPVFPHGLQEKRTLGRKDDAGRFRIIQATLEEHQLA